MLNCDFNTDSAFRTLSVWLMVHRLMWVAICIDKSLGSNDYDEFLDDALNCHTDSTIRKRGDTVSTPGNKLNGDLWE